MEPRMDNTPHPRRERGLTLIELMVAMVIGLLIVIAMSALFVGTSASRREVEASADVVENGRYALDLLTRELSQAGFYGTLATPTGATNAPCSTDIADWQSSLTVHVMGWNSGPAASDPDPGCLNRKAGTDAIMVQRAATCFVGETNASGTSICDAESNKSAYLQVSECGTEYLTTPFVVATGGTSAFTLKNHTCDAASAAVKRRLVRRIFYVDASNALASVDLRLDGAQAPVRLVENVEQLQIEYGLDTNGDGTADAFTSAPTAAQWPQAIGARVWLVARSASPSKNASNAASFEIGDFTGVDAVTVDAAARNLKRRVYSSYIAFQTPKARLES